YARSSDDLHRLGRQPQTLKALRRAAARETIPQAELDHLTTERQRIIQTVSRISRASNFREQVLNGYGHRCAVTRLQLNLIDAAHILPVAAPGSPDHIVNGVALSPTYHRAFDCGLIYLDEHYVMKVNTEREQELMRLQLDGGLQGFKAPLGMIHLPADPRQRPDTRFIHKANQYRNISA
ncbi:MAG: HNH endonuclease, partial [Planctomycetota bacterium]